MLAVGPEEDLTCLRNICTGAGWTVLETRTVRQALAEMRRNAVPVVFCQHKLPDGDWTGPQHAVLELPQPPYLIL
jgi:hypothetical protein